MVCIGKRISNLIIFRFVVFVGWVKLALGCCDVGRFNTIIVRVASRHDLSNQLSFSRTNNY